MKQEKKETLAELNGYIPKDVKTEFKKACVAAERTMSDVLTEIVQEWIAKESKK